MPISVLEGNETLNNLFSDKNDVFKATHVMEGGTWKRSSLLNRSFISFSFGGKFIEDFGLIATIPGDRLQKNIYSDFENRTTSYDTIDGQYYWGTHLSVNTLNFTLSTDGITDNELNEFKQWFAPGKTRELFLAENPNRAILARVESVPVYSIIPFEKRIEKTINGQIYYTSTTLYKGDINLSLISDEPYWYARLNCIPYYFTDENNKIESVTSDDTASNLKTTINDKDFLKIIVEDNIPHISMLAAEILLGGNTLVIPPVEDGEYYDISILEPEDNGLNIGDNTSPQYLYYCGTAPSKPITSFQFTPILESYYIKYPLNTYSGSNVGRYNTLTVGSSEMYFSLPSILYGYNQAISTITKFSTGESIEDVRVALISDIKEYYSRAWALFCLNLLENDSTYVDETTKAIKSTFVSMFKNSMKYFITADGTTCYPAFISLNSETGEAIGKFQVRVGQSGITISNIQSCPVATVVENVGDMLKSDYLILIDSNHPNVNGIITYSECVPITTDYPNGLQNVVITFKNMYY